MTVIGGAPLLLGFIYHDLPWDKLLPATLWIVVGGVGLFAWFAAVQMLFSTTKAANLITSIIVFPMLMMGGSFFPLDVLPEWLSAIGRLSPNGFIVDQLTDELTSPTAWTFDLHAWSIVGGMTLSGLAISTWRLQSGFARK